MERHVLIAGRNSAMLEALMREALDLQARLLVTLESGQDKPVTHGHEEPTFTIWNCRSPLSARSVLIRAANTFETVEEVFVVYSAEGKFSPLHELSAADIETKIDADVKGYLFLVRETLLQLSRQRSGTLTFVFHQVPEHLEAPLEAASAAAFRATVGQLFTAYQNEPIFLRGIESSSNQIKEFARFVLAAGQDRPERTRGKWLKYSGKQGLFSFVR